MSDHLKDKQFATRAVQAGQVPEDGTRSVTTAIYPSSTYRVAYPGDESGYVYSRWSNPTRKALERGIALLEGGSHGFAFSSGLAALSAVLHLLKPGDHVVAVNDLYGGTHRQFEQQMTTWGLSFSYVDGSASSFEDAITPATRLFWIETPTNPLLKLVDIPAAVSIAKGRDILVAVDNTFATPFVQQPLTLGADICHHSVSKYLAGHADVIAGALVVNDEALAEKLYFQQYAIGAQLGPFESWLVLRGMKTLHVRMERHAENARAVADWLADQSMVRRVFYPGLTGETLPNDMHSGGGMVSFELDADFERVSAFCTATEVFMLAESLGGVESLINHPAAMTHASIPKAVREANGISDQLIRLSVGIESVDDQLSDLKAALAAVAGSVRTTDQ